MIQIAPGVTLDEDLIDYTFILATGPGGQHVNKSNTAVQLKFPIHLAEGLPAEVRRRLVTLAGKRVNPQGILTLVSREHRSQVRNRQEALERLIDLIRRAAIKPKARKPTKPSKSAKQRRLQDKAHRGRVKSLRGKVDRED